MHYVISVEGHIGPVWSRWFDNLTVEELDDGTTRLDGVLTDQAALHGVLNKIRDLGLPLLSVQRIEQGFNNSHHQKRGENLE